jgi:hypothetical protein
VALRHITKETDDMIRLLYAIAALWLAAFVAWLVMALYPYKDRPPPWV